MLLWIARWDFFRAFWSSLCVCVFFFEFSFNFFLSSKRCRFTLFVTGQMDLSVGLHFTGRLNRPIQKSKFQRENGPQEKPNSFSLPILLFVCQGFDRTVRSTRSFHSWQHKPLQIVAFFKKDRRNIHTWHFYQDICICKVFFICNFNTWHFCLDVLQVHCSKFEIQSRKKKIYA